MTQLMLPFPEISTFDAQVAAKLGSAAASKGYDGPAGQLVSLCDTLPHAVGEIIYKAVRYARKGDPDDLVKIAAWAELIWQQKHAPAQPEPPESPSTSRCT